MWMKLLRFFSGYVRFSAEGGFPERFLSDAAANGLQITDAVRQGERFSAACPAGHYRRLRPLAKRACMRLKLTRKTGLYFHLFPYRKRVGLPIGLILAAILLWVLSGRIWVVTVQSEVPVDEDAILAAVAESGVFVGCSIKNVDMQTLRIEALSKLDTLVYVSVNPSGCVARVAVNTRVPTPSIQDFHQNYSNVIAARDGRILRTEVYSGQAAVAAGDGVTEGMLLVSGTVQSGAGNLLLRRAAGKIIAETEHTVCATVALEETQFLPQGTPVCRPFFRFLRWDIPLFSHTPLYGRFAVNTRPRLPHNGEFSLPIGLVDTRYTPLAETVVTHSKEEAAAIAIQRLQENIAALTESGVTVTRELDRTVTATDTAYTVSVTLLCEENIAREIPLNFAE